MDSTVLPWRDVLHSVQIKGAPGVDFGLSEFVVDLTGFVGGAGGCMDMEYG
jgi:hypothetical protein